MDIDLLKQRVAWVLSEAKQCGATSAEAAVSMDNGISVTVRLGEVETLEHHRNQEMGITLYKGKRKGSASTTDFNEAALREAVKSAASIASLTSEDEFSGLADAALMVKSIPDLDLYYPWDVSPEQAIDLAQHCEQAARDIDVRITNSEGATVNSQRGAAVYGNTHGFLEGYAGTRHSISCSVIAAQAENMQRDYWYSTARRAEELEDVAEIGHKAASRAIKRLNARQLSTRKAAILFSPEMSRSLLGHLLSGINGTAIYRKASFLLDKPGQAIFPEYVHIHEQPHLRGALGSAPFDNEGVATQARDIVREGVLQGYILDSYAARKLGLQATGNAGGVHNLSIEAGQQTQGEMISAMQTGLLVTEMMGHGVNMLTGDYSRGVSGHWIEKGEIQYPVEEITIAGNLQEMFRGVVAIGNDVDMRGNIRTGSMWIDKMTIAGN